MPKSIFRGLLTSVLRTMANVLMNPSLRPSPRRTGRGILAVCMIGLACYSRAAEQSYTIAVIPKGTTHEFWKAINAGAVKAQRELSTGGTKVEIIWKGPLREDDRDQQIQVVENFMARHVSAMVLAPLDSQA